VLGSPSVESATSDSAFLEAMLEVEAALVLAAADAGLVPTRAAGRVAALCRSQPVEVADIAAGWDRDATPVVALVAALRALAGPDADHVHPVATSQDVVDSATVLVVRRAVAGAGPDVDAVVGGLVELARRHRETPQAGRTLQQVAWPTTFGAACATRALAVREAQRDLDAALHLVPAQLGGAVGTLSGAGPVAADLRSAFADRLGLPVPAVPWHVRRGRLVAAAAAAAGLAAEMGAVGQDLIILGSSDVAEVLPARAGRSSSMPGKRNPADAVLAVAAAHRVPGLAATLLAGQSQELQRSAGRWQAEWSVLVDLLGLLGGAARHAARALLDAEVDVVRMRANLGDRLPEATDLAAAAGVVDAALRAVDP
jgi:3-carboxy-cis,cis-muconate cycloisomerase